MILCFELSMPNVGSWNGKWSGEADYYAKTRSFGRGKEAIAKASEILDAGYYHYNFGDGWSAGVSVRRVDSRESAKIRRRSRGFCGYDWMIDSILKHGTILIEEKKDQEGE